MKNSYMVGHGRGFDQPKAVLLGQVTTPSDKSNAKSGWAKPQAACLDIAQRDGLGVGETRDLRCKEARAIHLLFIFNLA